MRMESRRKCENSSEPVCNKIMSVAEIIKELSKLTSEERSAIRQWLREFKEVDEALFLHEAASKMFQGPDKQETH
jgi:hypothetical protein